jgi:cytoskeletal protein RodZ
MSNIFTYAIDERTLKIQLKGMEAAATEQAWHKFEMYADAHPFTQPQNRFKNFQVNLNRNVVLPVVFGVIICLFSFLLFNFISIKNPHKAELNNEASQPEIKINNDLSLPMETSASLMNSFVSKKEEPKAEPLPVVKSEPVVATTIIPETNTTSSPVTTQPVVEQVAVATVPATNTEVVPKRKKRNAEEEQLSEIRPTTVSDEVDEEVEIIPN